MLDFPMPLIPVIKVRGAILKVSSSNALKFFNVSFLIIEMHIYLINS